MSNSGKSGPFGALLGAMVLVSAIIFVAGFSYRWSYYYNFGLNYLLFGFSAQSVMASGLELIRKPANAALSGAIVLGALICVNAFIWASTALARAVAPARAAALLARLTGLESQFVVETLRALALVYGAFLAGNLIGYRNFAADVVEGPRNPLPVVTIAAPSSASGIVDAVLCNRGNDPPPAFIGSARTLRHMDETAGGCSMRGRKWRLLYRDENYIYIFATSPELTSGTVPRPLTLAVPRGDLLIMME